MSASPYTHSHGHETGESVSAGISKTATAMNVEDSVTNKVIGRYQAFSAERPTKLGFFLSLRLEHQNRWTKI